MNNILINDTFVRLSTIIKNDYKYSYRDIGKKIGQTLMSISSIETYYTNYPPLLDISELGAALEYEGTSHQDELIRQIKYKLAELKPMLPEYK